jgi:signal transduction histidine kinase
MWDGFVVEYERRWLTPVGLAVIGLVIMANAASTVGFGTSGDALVVTLGVAGYAVSALVFLLLPDAPRLVTAGLLVVMALTSALTHHGDPTGTGGIGLYLGMAFAPLRLDLKTAGAVSLFGVLVFDVQLALEAPNATVFIAVVTGGAAFFFFLGTLLRSEQDQRRRIAGLLADLQASREAEQVSAALAERARVAREMHDVLAHTLSGLVLQLEGLRLLAAARETHPEVLAALDRAHGLARTGLGEARHAITALRGDHLPGPEALPSLVSEHREATGQACRLTVTGTPAPLRPDARLAVYRTVQEALSNVRKHAPSAAVDVLVAWEAEELTVSVEDAEPVAVWRSPRKEPQAANADPGGYGLAGLAERAELLGGSLAAGPTSRGFRVDFRLPLAQARP